MIEKKINFTKKILEDLPLPAQGKRACYYDTKIRGLALSVTSRASKTFIVYRKITGKPERITLGAFPDLSVENARNMAAHVNSQIAQGKNPNTDKKAIKQELTLGELFKQFLEKYAQKHKKSWQTDITLYNCHLKNWENKKISSVKKVDIEFWHTQIGETAGKCGANRVLALLSTMYNKAIDWGWDGVNPCNGVKKFKEKSRERFIQGDEISRFFIALNDEQNETFKDFFCLCLLTGARRRNVQSMNWQDINFDRAEWLIKETKNGETHIVPLSMQATSILQERNRTRISDWVFPSNTSKSGHIEEPKKAWQNLLKRADIKDLRIHDLRRTLGSWQAATGANSYIIGKSLGHKTQQATAIYARLNIDPVRESINRATDAMYAAVTKNKD